MAVFEKFEDIKSGYQFDSNYEQDAWSNKNIRQKSILDEIEDFARWFETEQLKEWERNKVPEDQREDLGLMKAI